MNGNGTYRWNVTLEVAGDAVGADELDDRMGGLEDALTEAGAVVTYGDDRYGVRMFADGETAVDALDRAHELFVKSARAAELPDWPLVRASIESIEEFDRAESDAFRPVYLGVAELAERLGVTPQRASQITRRADFPRPVAELRAGPFWVEAAVEAFIAAWPRRAGRPPSAAPATARAREAAPAYAWETTQEPYDRGD